MFFSRASRYESYLYRRNRRRRRLAFFLIVALVLLGFAASHHRRARPAHPKLPAAASRTSPTAHGKTSRHRAHRAATASAAAGLGWTGFHGIALPSSPNDGPRHIRGGLAWGFADTPGGALVAAMNIAVRTAAQWGPSVYVPTIRYQVTGPNAAALLKADQSSYAALRSAARRTSGQAAGRGYAVEAAYRFPSWTRTRAVVDIVTEGPGSSGTVRAVTRIRLAWQRGDWRVIAPPGGDWASSASPVSSMAGFTPLPEREVTHALQHPGRARVPRHHLSHQLRSRERGHRRA